MVKPESPLQSHSISTDRRSDSRPQHLSRAAINRRLLSLAVPTFGQLIAEPAFILIDTAIVGHIGDSALAGLSVGSTIILTTVGLCVFLAYGTTSQVARLMGAGKRREGLETGIDGLWLALLIGIVVSVVIFFGSEPLCAALGARGDVLANAVIYVRALAFGLPGMLLVYAVNGIFRGLGRVKMTLIAAVVGAVINTILDVLFVFGLHWGIAGSGFATFIAQWCMALFLIIPALKWAKDEGARCSPRLSGIAHTAKSSVPLFIRTLALRSSMVATVMLATSMGTHVLASYQVVNSNWNVVLNMLDAIGIAGQSMVATELGAQRRDNASTLARASARFGMIGGLIIGIGMVVFGLFGSSLFSPTQQIQWLITLGMLVQGIFLPLDGWMWALDGILIGAGDYRYLATTCSLVAIMYVPILALTSWAETTLGLSNSLRTVLLWTIINVAYIGGRAVFNGLRIRGDAWMEARA